MDVDGNLHVYSQRTVEMESKGIVHHTSLLQGANVICAGGMLIENGQLLSIDNVSGHYRPKLKNLLNCIISLKNKV
jgi:hypothetical protein